MHVRFIEPEIQAPDPIILSPVVASLPTRDKTSDPRQTNSCREESALQHDTTGCSFYSGCLWSVLNDPASSCCGCPVTARSTRAEQAATLLEAYGRQ